MHLHTKHSCLTVFKTKAHNAGQYAQICGIENICSCIQACLIVEDPA